MTVDALAAGLERLSEFLRDWGRPAAIIGGMAIIARVAARATDDLDALVVATPADGPSLLEVAARHGYTWDAATIQEFLAVGLVRLDPPPGEVSGVPVDLIFADSLFLETVVGRAVPILLGRATLPVATIEDLLLLKLAAERPVDVDDILRIKDAFSRELDYPYLTIQAERLGLGSRLKLYLEG